MKGETTMKESVRAWLAARLCAEKGRRWLVVLGAMGVALLALSEWWPSGRGTANEVMSADAFVRQTEERLTAIVGSIEGAGKCRVLVTLENGVEYVYATEQRVNSDRQEDTDAGSKRLTERDDSERSVIVVETDGGRQGLLVTELQPTVRGVVVVCEGGDREDVRARVTEAVTVAMELSAKRVCVTKLT